MFFPNTYDLSKLNLFRIKLQDVNLYWTLVIDPTSQVYLIQLQPLVESSIAFPDVVETQLFFFIRSTQFTEYGHLYNLAHQRNFPFFPVGIDGTQVAVATFPFTNDFIWDNTVTYDELLNRFATFDPSVSNGFVGSQRPIWFNIQVQINGNSPRPMRIDLSNGEIGSNEVSPAFWEFHSYPVDLFPVITKVLTPAENFNMALTRMDVTNLQPLDIDNTLFDNPFDDWWLNNTHTSTLSTAAPSVADVVLRNSPNGTSGPHPTPLTLDFDPSLPREGQFLMKYTPSLSGMPSLVGLEPAYWIYDDETFPPVNLGFDLVNGPIEQTLSTGSFVYTTTYRASEVEALVDGLSRTLTFGLTDGSLAGTHTLWGINTSNRLVYQTGVTPQNPAGTGVWTIYDPDSFYFDVSVDQATGKVWAIRGKTPAGEQIYTISRDAAFQPPTLFTEVPDFLVGQPTQVGSVAAGSNDLVWITFFRSNVNPDRPVIGSFTVLYRGTQPSGTGVGMRWSQTAGNTNGGGNANGLWGLATDVNGRIVGGTIAGGTFGEIWGINYSGVLAVNGATGSPSDGSAYSNMIGNASGPNSGFNFSFAIDSSAGVLILQNQISPSRTGNLYQRLGYPAGGGDGSLGNPGTTVTYPGAFQQIGGQLYANVATGFGFIYFIMGDGSLRYTPVPPGGATLNDANFVVLPRNGAALGGLLKVVIGPTTPADQIENPPIVPGNGTIVPQSPPTQCGILRAVSERAVTLDNPYFHWHITRMAPMTLQLWSLFGNDTVSPINGLVAANPYGPRASRLTPLVNNPWLDITVRNVGSGNILGNLLDPRDTFVDAPFAPGVPSLFFLAEGETSLPNPLLFTHPAPPIVVIQSVTYTPQDNPTYNPADPASVTGFVFPTITAGYDTVASPYRDIFDITPGGNHSGSTWLETYYFNRDSNTQNCCLNPSRDINSLTWCAAIDIFNQCDAMVSGFCGQSVVSATGQFSYCACQHAPASGLTTVPPQFDLCLYAPCWVQSAYKTVEQLDRLACPTDMCVAAVQETKAAVSWTGQATDTCGTGINQTETITVDDPFTDLISPSTVTDQATQAEIDYAQNDLPTKTTATVLIVIVGLLLLIALALWIKYRTRIAKAKKELKRQQFLEQQRRIGPEAADLI